MRNNIHSTLYRLWANWRGRTSWRRGMNGEETVGAHLSCGIFIAGQFLSLILPRTSDSHHSLALRYLSLDEPFYWLSFVSLLPTPFHPNLKLPPKHPNLTCPTESLRLTLARTGWFRDWWMFSECPVELGAWLQAEATDCQVEIDDGSSSGNRRCKALIYSRMFIRSLHKNDNNEKTNHIIILLKVFLHLAPPFILRVSNWK